MNSATAKLIRPFASLRLTVTLLALSIFLIFAGTWAQIDMGIWATLKTYFRTFFVWIPFQIFLPRSWDVPGAIPFPGGFTLGGLLMLNLLTAHTMRFKLKRRQVGIWLIHFGLILLLAGETVTAMFAEESNMSIDEGQTVNFTEDIREVELAIIDASPAEHDRVVTVSESALKKKRLIQDPRLPFDLRVQKYMRNADLIETPRDVAGDANRGTGAKYNLVAEAKPVVSGVDQNEIDLPTALLTAEANGKVLGTWMTSLYFSLAAKDEPQAVVVDGKPYHIALRYKRIYKPYAVRLIDFKHDRYIGTNTPKNFSSLIHLTDPSQNEDREVLIYMNNPLRYRGETFYQASFKQGDTGTILQVVRNPGWLLPYIACTLGALGMLIHFGMHLMRFANRSRAA